ncbi:hypothetical protein GBA52_014734 [Prunus armeniaca]|nr:hypothetical protein GBA52_014734 [Prunus armeniaca]
MYHPQPRSSHPDQPLPLTPSHNISPPSPPSTPLASSISMELLTPPVTPHTHLIEFSQPTHILISPTATLHEPPVDDLAQLKYPKSLSVQNQKNPYPQFKITSPVTTQ